MSEATGTRGSSRPWVFLNGDAIPTSGCPRRAGAGLQLLPAVQRPRPAGAVPAARTRRLGGPLGKGAGHARGAPRGGGQGEIVPAGAGSSWRGAPWSCSAAAPPSSGAGGRLEAEAACWRAATSRRRLSMKARASASESTNWTGAFHPPLEQVHGGQDELGEHLAFIARRRSRRRASGSSSVAPAPCGLPASIFSKLERSNSRKTCDRPRPKSRCRRFRSTPSAAVTSPISFM